MDSVKDFILEQFVAKQIDRDRTKRLLLELSEANPHEDIAVIGQYSPQAQFLNPVLSCFRPDLRALGIPLAESLLAWVTPLKDEVLMGDPGRTYFPKQGVEKLGTYNVQTTRDLEDREIRQTSVYRLSRPGA